MTHAANIDGTYADDLGAIADSGNFLCDTLCLFDIATNNTSVSTQVHHGLGLHTAYATSSTSHKHNPVLCGWWSA